MGRYSYTAVSRTGSRVNGEMEAAARQTVVDALLKLGHLPVEVSETTTVVGAQTSSSPSLFSGLPSSRQVTHFTRELSILLAAGLPLDQSLALLGNDAESGKLKRLIGAVAEQIGNGKSLHEAMAAQGGVFPPIYTNMVRVGEASGSLETVLKRIADTREKAEKLGSKALSQMLYPCLLILMAIAAVAIMLTFVVPRFKDMILQQGTEVPDQARLVIATSDWLVENGYTLLFALACAVVIGAVAWRQAWGRRAMEDIMLRIPLVGHVMRLNLTVRFCRTLGILLENGVDLHAAMKLVRDIIGNRHASDVIDEAYDALRKGRSFLEPIAKSALFPPVMISMLRVGEETGNLTSACLHMADMFEDKMETAVQRTFTVLEPVVILLVSVFIGGIVVSIFSAVISMNDLAL
jgi:type II secretory pathway component PulF